ncbi:MAG: carboxypeptidase-like regulatory domain-containing protein [bacterium]|nr:carboxypeptidase-like regulatory domain-containing protein [bacterium]
MPLSKQIDTIKRLVSLLIIFLSLAAYSIAVTSVRAEQAPQETKRAFTVNGRIMDYSNKGVAGARIIVTERADAFESPTIDKAVYRFTTVTDDDGRFSVGNLPEQVVRLIVEREGAPRLIEEKVDTSKGIVIMIPPTSTLEIRAKRLVGNNPLVYLHLNGLVAPASSTPPLPTGKLPADGYAVYSNLGPALYDVTITNDRQTITRKVLLLPGKKALLDIDRASLVTVKGTVTRYGKPVSGARVSVSSQGMDSDSCKTDSYGQFELHLEETGRTVFNYCIYNFKSGKPAYPYSREVMLAPGNNTVNLTLPTGAVSGRVINAKSSRPLTSGSVAVWARQRGPSRKYYTAPSVKASSWDIVARSFGISNNGSFSVYNMSGGDVVIMVLDKKQQPLYIGKPIRVDEGRAKKNILLKVPDPGELDLTVIDAGTGKALSGFNALLLTKDGIAVNSTSYFHAPSKVPSGEYTLWLKPYGNRYFPLHTSFNVYPGKTTKIRLAVKTAEQCLVFKASPNEMFPVLSREAPEQYIKSAWIGYSLTDADTGKPVISGMSGPEWGGILWWQDRHEHDNGNPAIPLAPGTYLLDAVLRYTNDYAVDSISNLWKMHQKVVIKEGKDTVIYIK